MKNATVAPLPSTMADEMKARGIWREGCPVQLHCLSLVTVPFVDFEGTEHSDGEIVVLSSVAPQVGTIFEALYARKFPIAKMRPIHHYDGDDDKSMADNNTSGFNFRTIAGTENLSMHAYGLAIDINPLQNPYIRFDETSEGTATLHPPASWQYLNRNKRSRGMVEPIVQLISDRGFVIWGGQWTTPLDFQHFQVPRGMAKLLPMISVEDGHTLVTLASEMATQFRLMPADEEWLQPLIDTYKNDKANFFDLFIQKLNGLKES